MNKRLARPSLAVLAIVCSLPTSPTSAQDRLSELGPAGIRWDHTDYRGELSGSYRFHRVVMADNYDKGGLLSTHQVLNQFEVAPLTMMMDLHMVEILYGVTDVVSLRAEGGYARYSMDHVTRANVPFTTESAGNGDLSLGAIIGLKRFGSLRAFVFAGASLPTGSITTTGAGIPAHDSLVQLPYAMQIGSGTLDATPALTVIHIGGVVTWGFQTRARMPLGDNKRGWRRGVFAEGTAWATLHAGDLINLSARVVAKQWGDYQGSDFALGSLGPDYVPTVRPDLTGGSQIELPIGLDIRLPEGILDGHRLGIELSLPVRRDLHGPQLGADWALAVAWTVLP